MTALQSRSAIDAIPSDGIVLRTRDLTKLFGTRTAVDKLNIDVRHGEIFGFLGPNGAGKTTTIRMITGLITPNAGQIEILGHPVQVSGDRALTRIGALIETPALYPYLNGRDNLRAVGYTLGGIPDQRIDEILTQVGLSLRQKDRVRTYSLGMKQRLGVALALLNDPAILILDEPANGLDPAGIVEMRDLMRNLAANGKTIFISSHVLAEVQQICTRVGIINQGKLITESTIADLLQGSNAQGMYLVYVENSQGALAKIKAEPWGQRAYVDMNGVLFSPSPDGRGHTLNEFLVKAGFVPDTLTYQSENLEQIFLRLTNAGNGGVK
jgi:ABC-2 type transport system ATP-binding protein